jgi:hypothetical protein
VAHAYLFLLGLAAGLAILTTTSYRRISPAWLKWLLVASGLLVMSRYVTMALFTSEEAPQRFWALRHCWHGTAIGLTLPSVFAVDQLIRHPAMTPKKLLIRFAPFLAASLAILLVADLQAVPDRVVGWSLKLTPPWRAALIAVQGAFVLGFVGVSLLLMAKLPSWPIRRALLGLVLGHGSLALDGLLQAAGHWYFRPNLYSEMVTLLALWHAYETAASLQQSP